MIKRLGIMIDCSRDAVYRVNTLKRFIDIISKMGFNTLMLYTEDTYSLDNEPYFGYMRGRYSNSEIKELDDYAYSKNIELIPCIQTLAHLSSVCRWQEYSNECVDGNDSLLVGANKTYELIEKMFKWANECFRSKYIHIGMDEAFSVGTGRYLNDFGYEPQYKILYKHLLRIEEIAKKYNKICLLWSDMFVKNANNGEYYPNEFKMTQEIIDSIPKDMELIYWDYNHTDKEHFLNQIEGHKKFNNKLWFSGAVWSNLGFSPHTEYSNKCLNASINACLEKNIENILITSWKDDGAESSLFVILRTLAYVSSIVYKKDEKEIFENATGWSYDDFKLLDLPDYVYGEPSLNNPCKYGLYNDPFLGLLDYHLKEIDKDYFDKLSTDLYNASRNKEYEYIFDTIIKLCNVMKFKMDLGLITRRAYKENDISKLNDLVDNVYPSLENSIEELHIAFFNQWIKECKFNGFEVHDIRLGGLKERIKHCREMLIKYLNKEVKEIEPLEEEILPYELNKEKGEGVLLSIWMMTSMTKPWN